jgi:hypothetical protein
MLAVAGIVAPACQRQQREQERQQAEEAQRQDRQLEQEQARQRAQQAQPQQGTESGQARVDLDRLEGHPDQFLGRTVTVEGEVDRVLGPNVFTIDERRWADFEREMPVVVPEPFTAIVRTRAPVRVTGTVQKVPIAQVERVGGLLTDPKIRAEIQEKPALVATEVSTLAPATVAVNLLVRPAESVGTAGRPAAAAITDAGRVSRAKDNNLVGRRVALERATVSSPTEHGFWIRTAGGERIYVMPVSRTSLKEGQSASIHGIVLELPEGMRATLNASGEQIYIYADHVMPR